MKSSKWKMTAILLAAAFLLSGCGEALYEMTPEEEAAIVSYASQVLSKYNKYQRDGEVYIGEDTPEPETEKAQTEEEPDVKEEDSTQETPKADAQTPEESPEADSQAPLGEGEGLSSINAALDLGVVQAEYTGNSLCATYEKSDTYVVDAPAGKQLLAVNVKLTNPSNQDLQIDILSMTPAFGAAVNGAVFVPAQTTILPNDLSTYQGKIAAGESLDTVLLFEIPQEIQEISSIQLKIRMAGAEHTVNL